MLPYKFTKLPSGLRVILAPMKQTQAVTVLVLVAAGSKYEQKRINGISHFLEHLFFKGTRHRPTTEAVAAVLDGVGAEHNAFTSKEYTGYWVKASAQHTDLALDIVSDMLTSPLFEGKEIEKERRVIFEELNLYFDTPTRFVEDLFEETVWGDQPAGWYVGGTKESVSHITRKDILAYFKKYYGTLGTVVCVAGNIDPKHTTREISRRFSTLPKRESSVKPPVYEDQTKPKVTLSFKPTDQTHIAFGARAFNHRDPRRFALLVLATILGGNMSSRLFLNVRDHLGLAYYIGTSPSLDTDSGYIMSHAGIKNSEVLRALEAIRREYDLIAKKPVNHKELLKAKDYLVGRFLLGLEETDEVASYLATQELLKNVIEKPEHYIEKIREVSSSDVISVAQDVFKPSRFNLALIGPHKNKDGIMRILSR
ncbi:MAG: hypothetical protein A3A80_01920 [Candidatus Terrybacteria bacterium RIFCSPLOWO2_01_FULL_44_24]|uniref:Peptidase M16 n=1 Tax=Candidatus Terrybacteria bacterium RIFCSPHIGHO2_01_FULL_43_35 TaxID=1802361 RepID=A0A1G2PE92_9BACT|nr:MAG: hypothetical protein A2828_01710 [Candidatus Terrybacteria bacterium RIFCSPHIGHO2_01_FULL_43_35]OHA50840.1 MAG: hypothetical protein A3A80_01920 [Candidatus Terrybacteria bacterium RIFCSPLOWO2_01_FULL_44_24]